MTKVSQLVVAEQGFPPRSIRVSPTHQDHTTNRSKLTSPRASHPSSLFSPSPSHIPPDLLHIPGPCRHLGFAPTPSTPSPTPSARYSHPPYSRLALRPPPLHPIPSQKPQLTRALPASCSSFPRSYTQSWLLLHLFTGAHIHHGPQQMPQTADLTFLLWTSHHAQAVMDKSPPCTAPTPGMINWLAQLWHLKLRKLVDSTACLCRQPMFSLEAAPGNSLAVQWLGLGAFTAKGLGSIPGQGTKVPQAMWHGQKKKESWSFSRGRGV